MVELSIIIPTTKPRSEIPCLEYLEHQDFTDYEVVIRSDPGASKARNEAIKRAEADKLVFLDDDSMPRDGFLRVASETLDEHHVVAGRVFQPEDTPAPIKELDFSVYDQGDQAMFTDKLVGCNMAMRREVLETVGYFDETFHHGHEETELRDRILEEYRIFYQPEMVVDHYFADSIIHFWKVNYRHGKSLVTWWEVNDLPLRTQVVKCFRPSFIPANTVEAIGRVFHLAGRLTALTMGVRRNRARKG